MDSGLIIAIVAIVVGAIVSIFTCIYTVKKNEKLRKIELNFDNKKRAYSNFLENINDILFIHPTDVENTKYKITLALDQLFLYASEEVIDYSLEFENALLNYLPKLILRKHSKDPEKPSEDEKKCHDEFQIRQLAMLVLIKKDLSI